MADKDTKVILHPDGSGDLVRVPADMDTEGLTVVEEAEAAKDDSAPEEEPKVVMTKPAATEDSEVSKAKAAGKTVAKKA
jgi:hypothetical protein